jgi:hypothetical protein
MLFKWMNDKSIIDVILKVAGYTYGPLLGLFAFGILTHRTLNDKYVLYICLLAPIIILGIDVLNNPDWFIKRFSIQGNTALQLKALSTSIFNGFKIGTEILILNGMVTFIGLWCISAKGVQKNLAVEVNETN